MSKIKDRLISLRVNEDIYAAVKKHAEAAGQTVSDFMLGVIEDMLDENKDSTLLIRNTYDEVLKLGDMLSIIMGYSTEAYATILSRLIAGLTDEQLKDSVTRRQGALNGLRKYIRQINQKLNEGENVWGGENPTTVIIEEE